MKNHMTPELWFKLLALIAVIAVLCAGCSTTNVTKLTNALAKDGAVVVVKVSSIYGTLNVTRIGPQGTNSATVSPDGTVTVKPPN